MTTTTATAEPAPSAQIPHAIAVRWTATTTAVRSRVAATLARLRAALDLPSATEVAALVARLDAIDARLAALAESEAANDDEDSEPRRRGRARRS
ncbi:MAG: hypothetical protein IPL61_10365 [Myxococcales bacterium]|nr:hypothetical protein [Myxococcales bacterium]